MDSETILYNKTLGCYVNRFYGYSSCIFFKCLRDEYHLTLTFPWNIFLF